MVARNVAAHIERHVLDKPREWSPLVYCWRGGKRSGALATVLDQIGFRVHVLEGGYREYRRAVVAALETLPATLRLARRLRADRLGQEPPAARARARSGAQVLDLEALANHRGSVLGLVPGSAQPSQKAFDSRVWDALRGLDPARPVFVESESKKIGDLRVPEALIERDARGALPLARAAARARVALLMRRVRFLRRRHRSVLRAPRCLARAARQRGRRRAGRRRRAPAARAEVVRDLLVVHYDPIYLQSMRRNFAAIETPLARLAWDGSDAGARATRQSTILAGARLRRRRLPGQNLSDMCRPTAAHVQAAVDREVGAGGEARLVGGQPRDHRGDVLRRASRLTGMSATILSSTSWRIAITMSVAM